MANIRDVLTDALRESSSANGPVTITFEGITLNVDARTGGIALWKERYDRARIDLIFTQREIVSRQQALESMPEMLNQLKYDDPPAVHTWLLAVRRHLLHPDGANSRHMVIERLCRELGIELPQTLDPHPNDPAIFYVWHITALLLELRSA